MTVVAGNSPRTLNDGGSRGGLNPPRAPAGRRAHRRSAFEELVGSRGFSSANRYRTARLEHREYWRPLRIRRSARAERARAHRKAAAPARRPLVLRTSVAATSSAARAAATRILLASACRPATAPLNY